MAAHGAPIDLGPRMQQLVLLDLVLRANSVVATESLIDHLWGDDPPRSARTTLRAYVSNLRRMLPDDLGLTLATRRGGYSAVVDDGAIDVVRFERFVAEAQQTDEPAARLDLIDRALALASGPVLPELAREELAVDTVHRVEGLVLAARSTRAACLTELGRPADAVVELESLVRTNPIDERLRALLMTALYRAGRQTDALRAYEDARTTLVEELGIDPSPELRDLERRILEHDPSLEAARSDVRTDAPTPVPDPAPAPRAPTDEPASANLPFVSEIVGRDGDLSRVASRLADAAGGHGQVLIVEGPAGIGKSTFVNEVTRRARAQGRIPWQVLWGQCVDAEEVPSLWPISQIIDTLDESDHPALAPFLPGGRTTGGDSDLFHFHRAFMGIVAERASAHGLLLLIEDVHVADTRTIGLLQHVAASIRQLPVVLAITSRPEMPDATAAALNDIARLPHTTRLGLAPLDDDAVLALLNQHHGFDIDRAAARRLVARTNGNALFVSQLVNAHGARSVDPDLPLPETSPARSRPRSQRSRRTWSTC